MAVTLKQVTDFVISWTEQSRKEKNNKYYVVGDVVNAINQLDNIRKFYHASEDNKS